MTRSKALAVRGRPRDESATPQILKAALRLVLRDGFRSVSMEAIAVEARVGKTTIYRRWPNKAAVVMGAFLADIGPRIPYPRAKNAPEQIRLQMRSLAREFNGRAGNSCGYYWVRSSSISNWKSHFESAG